MLIEHKQKIHIMRQEGRSYSLIAATLGIPFNTVKSYCRRNNITVIKTGSTKDSDYKSEVPAVERERQTVCKNCGKLLSQSVKGQPKKFCSEKCRRTWWKANEQQLDRKAYYSLICSRCGIEFRSYGNKSRKFCSHSCYISNRFRNAGDVDDT